MNELKTGVRKWGRYFFIYKGDEREMTHLCLDGGKLHVPFDRVEYFNTKMGADIARDVRNFIVERRTPAFRFHADLDIFEPTVRLYSDIKSWISEEMCEVLRQFYPQFEGNNFKELSVIVCTTEPKKGVEKYGKVYDKVGVHLLFPWLVVDTESSMILRSGFIQWFEKKFGKREEGYNEWSDVFDKTVYLSNGLSMVGCAKMERCKSCKGKANKDGWCDAGKCNGTGKYDIGRIYTPHDVIGGDGVDNKELLGELLGDEIFMVSTTSIRCDPDVICESDIASQSMPEWFDTTKDYDLSGKDKPVKTIKVRSSKGGSNERTYFSDERLRLMDEDLRVRKIVEWFKNDDLHDLFMIPSAYRECVVQDVIMCSPSEGKRYYLVNVDSRYCLNIGNEHKNNGVYFVINGGGLFQKCFCRCSTIDGRISGLRCEQFSSDMIEIPDDIIDMLFAFEDDNKKNSYLKFMDGCNNSLSNIKDKKKLLSALLSMSLDEK